MQNYKIEVSYDGAAFSGWQIQDGKNTIQQNLQAAIEKISGEKVAVVGSGRTDAGVSAVKQVANFFMEKEFECDKLVHAINAHLPTQIAVLSAIKVEDGFNARFSAKKKTYAYYFYTSCVRNPLLDKFALKCKPLDVNLMQQACKLLIGEKNFKSFVAANSGKSNFIRTVYSASICKVFDNVYKFEICGNGFLYNMVRIIMGTLIDIGLGKISLEELENIIKAENRSLAGKTVPAKFLILMNLEY